MEWIQLVISLITVASLFMWARSESRSDNRHLDAKIDSNHKDTLILIEAIRQDIKDFHGRLCEIEERYRSKH